MWRNSLSAAGPLARRLRAFAEPAAGALLLLAVATAMAVWTWNAWADPLVDFGRDVYVAWRVAEGEALYRDVAYFNGPLSPCVNAAVLATAGPSIEAIYSVNFAILAAVVLLVRNLFGYLAGRWCGVACAGVFLLLFAFAQYTEQGAIGGYNYIAPYSHEMTHGVFLSLLGLLVLKQWFESGRRAWLAAAGVALGLTFLTKPEIFLATACGYGIAVALAVRNPTQRPARAAAFDAAVVLIGAICTWGVSVALLAQRAPWSDALMGSLGAWPHVANRRIAEMDFYRWVSGLDAPRARFTILVFWLLVQIVILRVAVRWAFRTPLHRGWLIDVSLVGGAAAIAWRFPAAVSYPNAFASLPAWLLVILAAGWWKLGRECERPKYVTGLATAALSLVLLAKVLLNARIYHYGFVLAMPATLTVVAACWKLAEELRARGGSAWRVALPPALFLAVLGGLHLAKMESVLRRHKDAQVQAEDVRGPRALQSNAAVISAMLSEMERRVRQDQTLAVWPQGAMMNVLARRRNSTPYVTLLPPEMEMFGEKAVLNAYRRRPPDFVLLVTNDTRAYGRGQFGQGYAVELWDWMRRHYAPVVAVGGDPLAADEFGMMLLSRRAAVTIDAHERAP